MAVVLLKSGTKIERNFWKNCVTDVHGKKTPEHIGLATKVCDIEIVKFAFISYNTKCLITSFFLETICVILSG